MADDSQELKIHIVSDADNTGFKAAGDASRELGSANAKAADSTNELSKKQEDGSEKATHATAQHKALHAILHKLNELVPGLGSAVNMLAKAHQQNAAATTAGAAANESFLVSMGPFAVALLAIQAASTYWDAYKEKSTAALESQAKRLDKLLEVTNEMIKARDEFNEAMERGASPIEKINKELDAQTTILKANLEAEKNLLKAREEAELAAAKTPEQKEEIKSRYNKAYNAVQNKGEAGEIELTNAAALKAAQERARLQGELDELTRKQIELTRGTDVKVAATEPQVVNSGLPGDLPVFTQGTPEHMVHNAPSPEALKQAEDLGKKIEELRDQIKDLSTGSNTLTDRAAQAGAVANINYGGRTDVDKTQDSAAMVRRAEAIAERGAQTQPEQQFVMKVAQLGSGRVLNLQQAEAYLKNLEKHPEMLNAVFSRLSHYNDSVLAKMIAFDRQIAAMQAQLNSMSTTVK